MRPVHERRHLLDGLLEVLVLDRHDEQVQRRRRLRLLWVEHGHATARR